MSAAPLAAARAVLFDLDGTLVDSAPDLAGAGNAMRAARGLPPLPLAHFRPMVGAGARGIVGQALGVGPHDDAFPALRDEFLALYEQRLADETRVFEAIAPVLDAISTAGRRWGIVTNKAARFTQPLVRALGLDARSSALVSGDTTPHAKPHPAPLLEAARQLGLAPQACVYVGDDLRDVQAGRAAGMPTVAAAWGYLGIADAIDEWGADHVIERPAELLKLLAIAYT
jgi:phosphoglycolate phosphatase